MEVSCQLHASAILPQGEIALPYPLDRRLGEPQRRYGGDMKNILDPSVFHPVACRNTD
jgi:hypothetical protein